MLYWNTSGGGFQDSPEAGYYTDSGSQTELLASLNRTLADRRIAYNVRVRYHNTTGTPSVRTQSMVEMGQPSDNAVTASRTVTLYDSTTLTGSDDSTLAQLEDDSGASFYAPNVDSGPVYNRVEVRIITWRM